MQPKISVYTEDKQWKASFEGFTEIPNTVRIVCPIQENHGFKICLELKKAFPEALVVGSKPL